MLPPLPGVLRLYCRNRKSGEEYQRIRLIVGERGIPPPGTRIAPIGGLANLPSQQFARQRTAYVIRNARLDPEWASVDRHLLSIAGRAISTMIHCSGYNDVVRIYFTSRRDGVDYNLAYIGSDFDFPHKESFDRDFMRALFEYGHDMIREGTVWHKAPPLFTEPDGSQDLPGLEPASPSPR
jgi:hypothetical protein